MFPDDDRKASFLDKPPQLRVRMSHQRAGSVLDRVTGCAPVRARRIGTAVRGNHDAVRGGVRRVIERPLRDAQLLQALPSDGIVNELPQDGQRFVVCDPLGQRERVAEAKRASRTPKQMP
jgi:hypothetical protein